MAMKLAGFSLDALRNAAENSGQTSFALCPLVDKRLDAPGKIARRKMGKRRQVASLHSSGLRRLVAALAFSPRHQTVVGRTKALRSSGSV